MDNSEGIGTRRQAKWLSKRSSSLIRKAREISLFSDVDVAFIAFTPCGRVTKFSAKKRIEDILHKYVDLPTDKRYCHLKDVENVHTLRKLNHIEGEENKLHYLSNQIHQLELKIKKSQLEIEILDANLRDYEVGPEQPCPSMPELLWCERNLNQTLQRVIHRKNFLIANCSTPHNDGSFMARRDVLGRRGGMPNLASLPAFSSSGGEDLNRHSQNLSYSQLIMKLDPWISPYSSKVRDAIIQDILNGACPNGNATTPGQFGESNFPFSAHSSLQDSRLRSQSWPLNILDSPSMERNMPDCYSSPSFISIAQNANDVMVDPNIQSSNNNLNGGHCLDDPNTKCIANQTPESPKDPPHLHGISSEVEVENGEFWTATNQEVGSPKWDGFLLAKNLNLDDLDIII